MKFELQKVQYMPKELEAGILYVSEEFSTAAHLCACGCGSKIRTPLGSTEWSVKETAHGPSLYPSIGNWQEQCKSHYWMDKGEIKWAAKWSDAEILAGRYQEEKRRRDYYDELDHQRDGKLRRFWNWIKNLFIRR